jgi:chloramphenicol 3-O phosphotransferase
MEKGKIIFLNGVSSSGKTTLAKKLRTQLSEPFYWLSFDAFIDMSPTHFWEADFDKFYKETLSAFHNTVKLFSDMGINVIVDHVLVKMVKALEECVNMLHDYPVLFVHVTCPVEELRRREKERGDRHIGMGESQLETLEPRDTYDITVDTYNNSIEECVNKIIESLHFPEKIAAFKILWSQQIN